MVMAFCRWRPQHMPRRHEGRQTHMIHNIVASGAIHPEPLGVNGGYKCARFEILPALNAFPVEGSVAGNCTPPWLESVRGEAGPCAFGDHHRRSTARTLQMRAGANARAIESDLPVWASCTPPADRVNKGVPSRPSRS